MILWNTACYNFKGISIPPTVSTFYVDQFQNALGNAPPEIGQQFSESLKDIVLNGSRLSYDETQPDIEFSGSVSSFRVNSVAPQETDTGFGSALNRLEISISVDYTNNQDDEENWTQSFSFFADFDSTEDLASVQEDLILEIFSQLSEDVFNRAFTNW